MSPSDAPVCELATLWGVFGFLHPLWTGALSVQLCNPETSYSGTLKPWLAAFSAFKERIGCTDVLIRYVYATLNEFSASPSSFFYSVGSSWP